MKQNAMEPEFEGGPIMAQIVPEAFERQLLGTTFVDYLLRLGSRSERSESGVPKRGNSASGFRHCGPLPFLQRHERGNYTP